MGEIVLDLPCPILTEGTYLTVHLTYDVTDKYRTFIVKLDSTNAIDVCYHVSQCMTGIKYNSTWLRGIICRYATPEEIQELDDQLAAEGKRWNPNTMRIEKLRWKPKNGQKYYYAALDTEPYISWHTWRDDDVDDTHYQLHNCFKTEEEAKVLVEKIKKVLLEN